MVWRGFRWLTRWFRDEDVFVRDGAMPEGGGRDRTCSDVTGRVRT
jgi:hypothetical protein